MFYSVIIGAEHSLSLIHRNELASCLDFPLFSESENPAIKLFNRDPCKNTHACTWACHITFVRAPSHLMPNDFLYPIIRPTKGHWDKHFSCRSVHDIMLGSCVRRRKFRQIVHYSDTWTIWKSNAPALLLFVVEMLRYWEQCIIVHFAHFESNTTYGKHITLVASFLFSELAIIKNPGSMTK